METTLYAFVVAIFIVLISIVILIFWLFKNRWKFILLWVVAGGIGGLVGYLIPSNETNIMIARILNREMMIELSIKEVHMTIGSAIGLLVVVFYIVVQSMRKKHVLKQAVPKTV